MTKLEKARKFCYEIGELAKKYNLPVFVVTDGASLTRNNGNSAIRNARLNHEKWERDHGFDPDEDWGIESLVKKFGLSKTSSISIEPMKNNHKKKVVKLLDANTEYHMSISDEFKRYIDDNVPDYNSESQDQVDDPKNTIIVAVKENDILGYIMYQDKGSYIAIGDFYVDKKARFEGVGKKLMNYVVNNTDKRLELRCMKDNVIGYKFYIDYGFVVVKEDKGKKYKIDDYIMSYNGGK